MLPHLWHSYKSGGDHDPLQRWPRGPEQKSCDDLSPWQGVVCLFNGLFFEVLLRLLSTGWLLKFAASTVTLFCPWCHYNWFYLHAASSSYTGQGEVSCILCQQSVEGPGDLQLHHHLWVLVTDVRWTEPTVSLFVSGPLLTKNNSAALVLPKFAHSFLFWCICALFVQWSS